MRDVTRFAPSPTGDLHLGHAYAAHFARDAALATGGRYLVRIEDIDGTRCRPMFIERILEDLAWLHLMPAGVPWRQSQRMACYQQALRGLQDRGLVYPCFCSRKAIRDEVFAADRAPQESNGANPRRYPGTCRTLLAAERQRQMSEGAPFAWRLDGTRALSQTGALRWHDRGRGEQAVSVVDLDDVVVARKETPTSYHLSVVVDDAAQGVTLVTRGEDLFEATAVHRLLYALLDLPVPEWHHHPLCRDRQGRRLAKRAGDVSIRALRAAGLSPDQVLEMAEHAARGAAAMPAAAPSRSIR